MLMLVGTLPGSSTGEIINRTFDDVRCLVSALGRVECTTRVYHRLCRV